MMRRAFERRVVEAALWDRMSLELFNDGREERKLDASRLWT